LYVKPPLPINNQFRIDSSLHWVGHHWIYRNSSKLPARSFPLTALHALDIHRIKMFNMTLYVSDTTGCDQPLCCQRSSHLFHITPWSVNCYLTIKVQILFKLCHILGDYIVVPQTNVPNCDGKFVLRILTDEQSNIW